MRTHAEVKPPHTIEKNDVIKVPKKDRSQNPSGQLFDEFLNEDLARKSLTKSEQFVAYRTWRKEKGLNWSS